MLNFNSTIFKTITSSVDESRKTLALFNKDWNTYKTNWQNANGISGKIGSIFAPSNAGTSASVISNDQVQILRNWNNAVKHGCTNQATFNRIIANADENTKMYFAGLNKGKASMEGLKNAQNVAKTSTIGLTIAQTALNMAISMGLMAAISLAIKGFDKLVNSAKRASEAADEAFSETNDKVQEYDDELKSLDELIAKYKELKESGTLDLEGRKEIKEIQNDIADLVGTQAKNLDLVNGKLDDEIKKLDEISAKEAKRAYETATANYNNSQKANESATGDDSFLFVDGYAYTGKREKEAEKILKEAGFGGNVQSGGFFGNTLFVMDSFDNNMKELKGAQEKADYLQSMIDVLEQNGQRATDLYAGLIKQRDDYLAYIDNQQSAADSLVNSWLTYSQFSNQELSKINVDSVESFETYRQKMIDEAKKDESIGKVLADGTLSEEDLENAINDFMATSLNFSTWYEKWINNVQGSTLDDEITVLSEDRLAELEEQADNLNSIINEIQSSYNTLQSAIEEYNTQGYLSLDTLDSLLALDNEYLTCLVNENGQLSLNADAMNALAQSKLNEAEASAVAEAMTELQAIANGEAASSTANYISGNASLMQSLALLAGQYDNVANAAMTAAQAQELSAMIEAANAKDSVATARVMSGLNSRLGLIRSTASSISTRGIGGVSKSGGSSASKSASKTMEDVQKEWKEYLDKYLALYKAELDAGLIDFNTFLNKSRSMLDQFYREGKISAKDYWDFVKSLYEDQLSVYDKVLSAVTRRYDKEIEKINDIIDGIEEQNETLEKQLDEYDSILSVVDSVYEAEIDRIKEQQDAIDDTISKLKEENDEHQRAINLEKARWQLYESLNNRKVKLFNGQEFVYTTNRDEVREAQQNIADLEFQKTINALEKEQDALDAEIEKLEEFKSKWAEITDVYDEEINRQLAIALWGKDYEKIILSNRLSDIESFKNNYVSIQHQINSNEELIKSYNEKKSYYEDLKKQWSDISSEYKNAQEDLMAQQVLGANWEKDILSGRIDVLNNFKDKYIAIQKEIANAAAESAKAQAEASSAPSTSSTTSSGGGGSTTTTTAPEKQYHVVHLVGKGHKTQSEAQSNIVTNSGNGVYKYTDGMWYVYRNEKYTDKTFSTTSAADEYIKKQLTSGKYGILKYASGGIVKKDNGILSSIAKSFGEDTIIAAKDGERVLTPTQNEMWEKWTNALPNLQNLSNMINVNMPDYSALNNIVVKNREIQPSFSIGEIHLHEVNDVDNFAKAIIRELPSKVTQRLGK